MKISAAFDKILRRNGSQPVVTVKRTIVKAEELDEWDEVPATDVAAEDNRAQYETRVEELIRGRYSVGQEFAILRQQHSKPEEYTEYFNFCESCKEQARKEL